MNKPTHIDHTNVADYLSCQHSYCLFLDIDGTLAEFTIDPQNSFVPKSTLILLQCIQSYGVDIAFVTGRSLIEAKKMLSPLALPIAATHGLEIDFNNSTQREVTHDTVMSEQVNNIELNDIKSSIVQSCIAYDELLIEDKPYSVALHFRQNSDLADVAYRIMCDAIENYPNWVLKQGKYVWEIVPLGVNKGTAILSLLKRMQADSTTTLYPIFIGDDNTDEAGFVAIQGNNAAANTTLKKDQSTQGLGLGIKVGHEPTCAHYYVRDISEVMALLVSFLDFLKGKSTTQNVMENSV